ncbi:sugar ABC transporter permease [Paenibacillus crassostreae]|uniref:Maltose/maltodextrin transport system permease protein n=1 Tax=Paenibacillus crassostreae TaxID=1763538 RepID=A0A167BU26_9BACL|nr:sugar ABC transporter permease [Paenibacillus crassostreae]AOZ92495.1 sugar ABC transporter permease [Paenibacillus crassostreae]OAB72444.1 sugar ABC transporter permease [Paenibacillus crassostreae]
MDRYRNKATIMSLIFMGFGQIYNRQFIKGLIYLLIEAYAIIYFSSNLGRALWGIVTLGETPRTKVNGVFVDADHSIILLIKSLITILFLIIFIIIYIINVRDARKIAEKREQGVQANRFLQSIRYVLDYKFAQALLTLPAVGILFFTIMPIIFMVMLAFTNYSSPNHIPPFKLVDWVGFNTFKDLISLKTWSHTFYGVLTWTIIWAVLSTVTTYFGGLLVALLINQKGIRFKGFWRTILIIPYAIPQLISLLVMRNMFNGQFGPINQYITKYFGYFGLGGLPWLTDPFWAKVTVIIVNMWVGIPVSMILIMGVLTTIPRDMYEAAEVDGASNYQKFRIVTLPMVLFSTAPILIMQFAGNINNFNAIFLLTSGNPVVGDYQYAGATDLLVTWLYKLTLDQNKYNMASAVGIIIFLIIASFSIYNYRRTKSFKEEDMIQ